MSNNPVPTHDEDDYDDLEPTMAEVRATGLGFATEDMGPSVEEMEEAQRRS